MSAKQNPYYAEITSTLDLIRAEFKKLDTENISLRRQNSNLRAELERMKSSTSKVADNFGGLSDNDRMAMRQQLTEYINRIENLLES